MTEVANIVRELEARLDAERTARHASENRTAALEAQVRDLQQQLAAAEGSQERSVTVIRDAWTAVDRVKDALVTARAEVTRAREESREATSRLEAEREASRTEREMVERRLQALRVDVERTLTTLRAELQAERGTG